MNTDFSSSGPNPNKGDIKRYFFPLDTFRLAESLKECHFLVEDIEKKTGYTAVDIEIDKRVGSASRAFLVVTFKDKRWYLKD